MKRAMIETPGNLFVVAAPSGAGKSSLVKALLELDSHLAVSVSHTTRPPRGQEQHGREYCFIDEPTFRAMVDAGEFVEWAEVHGHLLRHLAQGRSRSASPAARTWCSRSTGRARCRSSGCSPNAVLIFILPPSWDELRQRLQRRGEDAPEVIDAAHGERAASRWRRPGEFDFVIINALFETALFDLKAIVHSQRLKYAAQRRSTSPRSSQRSNFPETAGSPAPETIPWPASPSKTACNKIPNRFQLVLAATYRARMLSQGHAPKIESKNKPGVTALREIAAGKIGIEMLRKVPGLSRRTLLAANEHRLGGAFSCAANASSGSPR